QNTLIAETWGPAAVPVCEAVTGRHHMSVLRELAEPGSRPPRLAPPMPRPAPAPIAWPCGSSASTTEPRSSSATRVARRQARQQIAERRVRPDPADPLRRDVEADEASLLPGLQALPEVRIGGRTSDQHDQGGERDQAE